MGLSTSQKLGAAIGHIEAAQADLARLEAVEQAVLWSKPVWAVCRKDHAVILFPRQKEAKHWARGTELSVQRVVFAKQTGDSK